MSSTHTAMLQDDLYTEFKQSFNEDTIVTLAAFANATGGYATKSSDGQTVQGIVQSREIWDWYSAGLYHV